MRRRINVIALRFHYKDQIRMLVELYLKLFPPVPGNNIRCLGILGNHRHIPGAIRQPFAFCKGCFFNGCLLPNISTIPIHPYALEYRKHENGNPARCNVSRPDGKDFNRFIQHDVPDAISHNNTSQRLPH